LQDKILLHCSAYILTNTVLF